MKLFRLISRYAKGAFFVAVMAGALSGLANAGLLALINIKLADKTVLGVGVLWPFVALLIAVPLLRVLASYLLVRYSQRAVFDLRMQFNRKILATPLRRLEEVGSHRLFATLTNDVGAISQAFVDIPQLSMHLAIVLGSLAYLAWLSLPMFLVLVIFLLVGIVSYQLPIRLAHRRQYAARQETDVLFKRYRGVIEGTKELKLHQRRQRAFLGSLFKSGERIQKLNVAYATIFTAGASWGQMLVFFVTGLILFLAPFFVADLTREMLLGYVIILLFLRTPLELLMGLLPSFTQARVALEKVEDLGLQLGQEGGIALHRIEDFRALPEATDERRLAWSRLDLKGVTHNYYRADKDASFTLGPLDLTVRAGEVLFLIGGNGSGKTTLAKLLVGLYEPASGEVCLNGKPMARDELETYWQQFAAVFSDFYLFDELQGVGEDRLDERVGFYLEKLQLHHKVEVRNGALSTTDLSQGQRKRLALLTAYLEDRPIYLFDEWAADQDPVFKELFYHQLIPELKERGKTIIVISHDDRYYEVADRIVKLDYGQITLDKPVAEALAQPLFEVAGSS
ncbi:MAG: cyclic peptide export ABC transporter [Deltaproteobacteria bacterium]|nr:cyclic peptide export ABC transporter [Deltaproteobacteria bacterium]